MKGRTIIRVQSIVISAMLTETIARVVYHDLSGWRLVLVVAAMFLMLYRTMHDITLMLLKGARYDQKTGAEGIRGTVPKLPWYKVRLRQSKQADRDTAKHAVQVSR